MRILNAKIENVTVGLNDSDGLAVMFTLRWQSGCCNWEFTLANPLDIQRLTKLMNYTGSHQVKELEGKIIRKVEKGQMFQGFGHPIEDKFVSVWADEFKEITELEVKQQLS